MFKSSGEGGGVLHASATETTMYAMLAARTKALKHLKKRYPGSTDQALLAKMTVYASDQVGSASRLPRTHFRSTRVLRTTSPEVFSFWGRRIIPCIRPNEIYKKTSTSHFVEKTAGRHTSAMFRFVSNVLGVSDTVVRRKGWCSKSPAFAVFVRRNISSSSQQAIC